jgi:2-amino-4-hydroxy-6-hydroxymethyldihydropteridine diphosphokinase
VPLAEIAAEVMHPVLKKNISELLAVCPDTLAVKKYA